MSAVAGMDQPWNDIDGGRGGEMLGLIVFAIAVYGIFKTWPLHVVVFVASIAIGWIASLVVGGPGGLFLACIFIVWALRWRGSENGCGKSETISSYPGEREISERQRSNLKEEAGATSSVAETTTQAATAPPERAPLSEQAQLSQPTKAKRLRPAYADLGMTTVIRCAKCSQQLRVPAGKLLDIRCKTCGHTFRTLTP